MLFKNYVNSQSQLFTMILSTFIQSSYKIQFSFFRNDYFECKTKTIKTFVAPAHDQIPIPTIYTTFVNQ